jgi:hypothetical protein
VQFLGEGEDALYADLALPEPALPEWASGAFPGRLNQILDELAMERAWPSRGRALEAERASLADARWRLVADTVGCLPAFGAAETLTRGADIDVLVSKPLEVFVAPDAGVGMAEAGGWDEGCDPSVVQMRIGEGSPVPRVGDHLRDGHLTEPPMVPKHIFEIVFVHLRP